MNQEIWGIQVANFFVMYGKCKFAQIIYYDTNMLGMFYILLVYLPHQSHYNSAKHLKETMILQMACSKHI